jgi:hypothetical protein
VLKAYAKWYKNIHHGKLPTGMTSEEYLVEQCAFVKEASNNRTKCFVYRNGEVSISWLSSEAAKMYSKDVANQKLFLQSGGRPYNEPGDGDPHAKVPNMDQYFFNFSNPAMATFWNATVMLGPHAVAPAGSPQTRCCGNVVDGLFIDDSTGLGTEHSVMVKKCGMSEAAIADWNVKAKAAYTASWTAVVDRGGFVWNLMRDPDGNAALTGGVNPQPLNSTCKAWMLSKCGNASWGGAGWPLMMSPEPGSEAQSLAAFLLLRGDYAWWGRGWLGGGVTSYNESLRTLDPGVPKGNCSVVDPQAGIFQREFTDLAVTLDCNTWTADFAAPSRQV